MELKVHMDGRKKLKGSYSKQHNYNSALEGWVLV